MTENVSTGSSQSSRRSSSSRGTDLVTEHGRTVIADTVVAKIVGLATRDVSGVHDVGAGATRMAGAVRERIPGSTTNHAQGVTVEVGEKQAAADIDIIADYGVPLADLGESIRRNVISAVERMTGLEVVEANVTVHDLHVDTGGESDQ
jgi:uncharacterized alkaline shock family protein YloU